MQSITLSATADLNFALYESLQSVVVGMLMSTMLLWPDQTEMGYLGSMTSSPTQMYLR